MKTAALLIAAGLLAVPALADGPAGAKPVVPARPLSKADRAGIDGALKEAAPKAKATLAYAAMTAAEARRLADVPDWLNWQVEYDGWFVFGVHDRAGGPDVWSGVVFVRKGTNVMGFYRETW